MNELQRIENNVTRKEAERQVDAVIASLIGLFDNFGTEDADVWKVAYKDTLIGSGVEPKYNADAIGRGFKDCIAAWKGSHAPKPAHIADFVAVYAQSRKSVVVKPWQSLAAATCSHCDSDGYIQMHLPPGDNPARKKRGLQNYIDRWYNAAVACDHTSRFVSLMQMDGWITSQQRWVAVFDV